jgi:hypothetical protein
LKRGRIVAALVIPDDFRRAIGVGRPTVQLLLDGTDPLTAARIGGYITQIAARFRADDVPDDRAHRPGGSSGPGRAPRSSYARNSATTRRCAISISTCRRWRGSC